MEKLIQTINSITERDTNSVRMLRETLDENLVYVAHSNDMAASHLYKVYNGRLGLLKFRKDTFTTGLTEIVNELFSLDDQTIISLFRVITENLTYLVFVSTNMEQLHGVIRVEGKGVETYRKVDLDTRGRGNEPTNYTIIKRGEVIGQETLC